MEHHIIKNSDRREIASNIKDYGYTVICLKNGEKFHITCLMMGFFWYLPNIKNAVEVKRYLPIIWKFWV